MGLDIGKTKVVEKGGQSIMSGMVTTGGQNVCLFTGKCVSVDSSDCTIANNVYSWCCKSSVMSDDDKDMIYIGTTSFSLHKLAMEHLRDIQNENLNISIMAKHQHEYHGEGVPDYSCKVLKMIKQILSQSY